MNARKGSEITQDWECITGDGNVGVLSVKETVKLLVDNQALSLKSGSVFNIDTFLILRLENDKVAEAWFKGNLKTK